ncbi:DUF4397 domain-containing protein [Mucilaginibacter robiniae]|uniref:DUF4397 domain-containing protein n=1 Tax=Mucilaginibacter robiniae TaxID=2728022 RepID=A0A7L5E4K2_9SPHI|nr:DUF4397 domain-containing protein [Mucilaginibacter robiniae]QJD95753.1 DUF4397 domain-containing protein [Mucilaginibacter robiniae]
MKRTLYIALSLLAATLVGCKKNNITQVGDVATGAQIKLIHAAPGVPALDGYINNTKVTPLTTVSVTDNAVATSISTGYVYLGVFPGSNYAVVAPGSTAIKIVASIPVPALKSVQTVAPGATVGNVTQATTNGSAYSVFTMGLPGATINALTTKIVEDKFPAAASNKAYIRLAYLIPNGAPVDLSATYTLTGGTATSRVLTSNTSYGNVTDFVSVDVNSSSTTAYTFQLYLTGTTTKLGTVSASIALAPGRYYTIIGRGLAVDYVVPGTGITLKASTRPTLPVSDPTTKYPEIYFNPAGITYYTNK